MSVHNIVLFVLPCLRMKSNFISSGLGLAMLAWERGESFAGGLNQLTLALRLIPAPDCAAVPVLLGDTVG